MNDKQIALAISLVLVAFIVGGVYWLEVGRKSTLPPLPPFQKQVKAYPKVKADSLLKVDWVKEGIFEADGLTIERRDGVQIMYGKSLPDTQVYKVVWKEPWEYWLYKVKDDLVSQEMLKAKITKAQPHFYECFVTNANNENRAISYQLRKLK